MVNIVVLVVVQDSVVTMGLLTENEMAKGHNVADSDSRDVSRFLNRILGLQVVLQNLVSLCLRI